MTISLSTPHPMAAPGSGSAVSASTQPWRVLRWRSSNQAFVERVDGLELVLMRIPPGSFLMGAPEGEEGSGEEERPIRRVRVGELLMGQIPVTRKQWNIVASWPILKRELSPIEELQEKADIPWAEVPWGNAVEFCRRLGNRTGKFYELPTEAQWEYACRAGSIHPFSWGPVLHPDLVEQSALDGSRVSAGEYANSWGLRDMHGNGSEWCSDPWHKNYTGAPADERAWEDKAGESVQDSGLRVMRGGGRENPHHRWRSAARTCSSESGLPVGFRICCLPPRSPEQMLFCSASWHGKPRSERQDKDSARNTDEEQKHDIDVFISYAHVDNVPLADDHPGWVTNFQRVLEKRLMQLSGEKKVRFLNANILNEQDGLIKSSQPLIEQADLLIYVVTPRSVKSEWCRRELSLFKRTWEKNGGDVISGRSRIFKVNKYPLPPKECPEEMEGLLGYDFYETTDGNRFLEYDPEFGNEYAVKFQIAADDLAEDIHQMIELIYQGAASFKA